MRQLRAEIHVETTRTLVWDLDDLEDQHGVGQGQLLEGEKEGEQPDGTQETAQQDRLYHDCGRWLLLALLAGRVFGGVLPDALCARHRRLRSPFCSRRDRSSPLMPIMRMASAASLAFR